MRKPLVLKRQHPNQQNHIITPTPEKKLAIINNIATAIKTVRNVAFIDTFDKENIICKVTDALINEEYGRFLRLEAKKNLLSKNELEIQNYSFGKRLTTKQLVKENKWQEAANYIVTCCIPPQIQYLYINSVIDLLNGTARQSARER